MPHTDPNHVHHPHPYPNLRPRPRPHSNQVLREPKLLSTALDCLDHLCRQRSSLLAARVASFFVRLVDAAATLPHGHAVALLSAASRLIVACPRIGTVLDGTDKYGPALSLVQSYVTLLDCYCTRLLLYHTLY